MSVPRLDFYKFEISDKKKEKIGSLHVFQIRKTKVLDFIFILDFILFLF